jgi:hypothetical protein
MSSLRLALVLLVLALGAKADARVGRACSAPRVDPKTGDVVAESEKQAVKDGPHGCAPAGGPKPDVPTQPTPAPEPETPAVATKPSEPPHRDQPIGSEKPAPPANDPATDKKPPATDTAANDQKPTEKPSV